MIAEEQLESRVRMVGAVPHEQARNVLVCHHLLAPFFELRPPCAVLRCAVPCAATVTWTTVCCYASLCYVLSCAELCNGMAQNGSKQRVASRHS